MGADRACESISRARSTASRRRDRRAPDGRAARPKYFEPVAAAGGDSVTFHFEAVDDVAATIRAAREHGLAGRGRASTRRREPRATSPRSRGERRHRALHGDPSRLLGPGVPASATYDRVRRLRARCSPAACASRSTAASAHENIARIRDARRDAARRRRRRSSVARTCRARTGGSCKRSREPRARDRARARRARAARTRSRRSARSSCATARSSARA